MTVRKMVIVLVLVLLAGIVILIEAPALAVFQVNAIEGPFDLLFSRIIPGYWVLGSTLVVVSGGGLIGLGITTCLKNS